MGRWIDISSWQGPAADNFGDGDWAEREAADRMSEHRGLVIHIAEGSYAGTVAWERNASSDISSHWVLAKDGRCAQMVDTDDRPWTQGAGNDAWLSVECEGYAGDSLTAQQLEVVAQLLARTSQVYGVPLQLADSPSGRGLGWHGMGGAAWGGHTGCPGAPIVAQRGAIVARAQEITGGNMSLTAEQDRKLQAADNAWYSVAIDADSIGYPTPSGGSGSVPNQLKRRTELIRAALAAVAADVAEIKARPPAQLTDVQAQQLADQILAAYGARLDAIEASLSAICGAMAAGASAQLAALGVTPS